MTTGTFVSEKIDCKDCARVIEEQLSPTCWHEEGYSSGVIRDATGPADVVAVFVKGLDEHVTGKLCHGVRFAVLPNGGPATILFVGKENIWVVPVGDIDNQLATLRHGVLAILSAITPGVDVPKATVMAVLQKLGGKVSSIARV